MFFKSFPDRKDKKELIIDATTLEKCEIRNTIAFFHTAENTIKFENLNGSNLLKTLAHELKHAEQYSSEAFELEDKLKEENGLAYHQFHYLLEAQAYIFEAFVGQLSLGKDNLNWDAFQKEHFSKVLEYLIHIDSYQTQWDTISPIDPDNDTDITANYIPDSCNIPDDTKKEILTELKKVPKETHPVLILTTLLDKQKQTQDPAIEQKIEKLIKNNPTSLFFLLNKVEEISEQLLENKPEYINDVLQTLVTLSKHLTNERTKENLHNNIIVFAISSHNQKLLQKLIDAGINVNAKSESETPLITAIEKENFEAVELLITHGAKLNEQAGFLKQTALLTAIQKEDIRSVRALVTAGADINVGNICGETAIDTARNNQEILDILNNSQKKQEKDETSTKEKNTSEFFDKRLLMQNKSR